MTYILGENLIWIIDKQKNAVGDENESKENREFVHSLGLKCDYVGWCNLDLESENADKIIEKIEKYCEDTHSYLRGYYKSTNSYEDNEWYKLNTKYISTDYFENENEIRAYKIPKNTNCLYENTKSAIALVSDNFRKVCVTEGFSGITFSWKKDIGKYKSLQYFNMYISSNVPNFYSCNNLSAADPEGTNKLFKLGGKLPKLIPLFYNINIDIPICIKKNDLPSTDFAYYKYDTFSYVETGVLIRKKVATILLERRLITRSDLICVNILDDIPLHYEKYSSEKLEPISNEDVQSIQKAYEEFLLLPKQEPVTREKMALHLLRKQKNGEKEYYNRSLSKSLCDLMLGTIYEAMVPYYKVCDGGVLSDEYTLLSYSESVVETKKLFDYLALDELIDPIQGVAIAKCADGDVILLTLEKEVKRISHENYEIIELWENVATFIYDAL